MVRERFLKTKKAESNKLQDWFESQTGQEFLLQQKKLLSPILPVLRQGYGAVLSPNADLSFLEESKLYAKFVLCEKLTQTLSESALVTDYNHWPIQSDSLDLVLIQHALESCQYPYFVLSEATRSLASGKQLIVLGFNPSSFWGAYHQYFDQGYGSFISAGRLSSWLRWLGFEINQIHYPKSARAICLSRFHGSWLNSLPFGRFYLLQATKQVVCKQPPNLNALARIFLANRKLPSNSLGRDLL